MATTSIVVPSARRTPAPTPPPPQGCDRTVNGDIASIRTAIQQLGSNGGTVCINPGSWDWTANQGPLVITTPITLRGAGRDATFIRDLGIKNIIEVTTVPGKPIRICHMTLIGGTFDVVGGVERNPGVYCIRVAGQGQIRVDHNRFDCSPFISGAAQVRAMGVKGGVTGVFDQNICLNAGGLRGAVETDADAWLGVGQHGDNSWAQPSGWGQLSSFFFYEDNLFQLTATTSGWAHDSYRGGRMVFRRNRMLNTNIAAHGTEAGGRGRGTRAQDIYQNVAPNRTVTTDAVFANCRSGSALLWKNKIGSGYTGICRLDNNRSILAWGTWPASDGACVFDLNDPGGVFDDGIMANDMVEYPGTNWLLTAQRVGGASMGWTPNHWSDGKYSIHNTSRGGTNEFPGCGDGGFIVSNTDTQIVINHWQQFAGPPPIFLAGDHFEIRRCLLSMDACGRGPGDLLQNQVPAPAQWVHQDTDDPCYAWGNTISGSSNNVITTPVPHIVEGRDFFTDGRVKPGYTPAVHPHPLRTSGPTWTPGEETDYDPCPDFIP